MSDTPALFADFISAPLSDADRANLTAYTVADYEADIAARGLFATWRRICSFTLAGGKNDFLSFQNWGDLYEYGLAFNNREDKKNSGQYYTPTDVSRLMAEWFDALPAANVCDVACGTGNLILAYFDLIGAEKTRALLKGGHLYLYDNDITALYLCKCVLLKKYGAEYADGIHIVFGDFLDKDVHLPADSKVISNPPYAATDIKPNWRPTKVVVQTRELYAAFFEKIIRESARAVMITPYSFIGGNRFYPLRQVMNDYNGFVVSFDNVPATIFCGKKHGIFNTNTSNSVRAAITVVENNGGQKGFRLSPLIRFKAVERKALLQSAVLKNMLGKHFQTVNEKTPMFAKYNKRLEPVFEAWRKKSSRKFGDYIDGGAYTLSMPNTCRYFTVAAVGALNRRGQMTFSLSDEDVFYFVFCLLNSSFAYGYWRIYDGGIVYPKSLLLDMPVFYDLLTADDKVFFKETARELIAKAADFIVTKKNVGVQENIKYPKTYRDKINARLLKILGLTVDESVFDDVHANRAL